MSEPSRVPVLVVRAGTSTFAIPAHHVAETMRPLAVERLGGTPRFVLGVAIIRGAPVPVVDLGTLLGTRADPEAPRRFVTVRAGERLVALAVDAVAGVELLDPTARNALPPLLQGADAAGVEALGAADAELLVVLRAAKLVPPEVWTALGDGRRAP